MKDHYFDKFHADEDDHLLNHYRAIRVVPDKCLLGGALIELAVQAKRDPCGTCPGPREVCRGRARTKDAAIGDLDASKIYADSTVQLTANQIDKAAKLSRLLQEAFR